MKTRKKFPWKSWMLTFAISFFGASATKAQTSPTWLQKSVFYQIYPSSFKDSDGNGIGDLPGITSKLDYIKSLGVNALWLNPVFQSGWFDGGYDVIDFYKIDPRFGTNTDLVTLVEKAHKLGIKVCLDLVAGHTSDKCVWFKQSAEADANLQHSDYYIWSNNIPEKEKELIAERKASSNPQSNTIGRYVEANAPRAKYYEKNFFECQPALNYGFAHPDPTHPWEQSVNAPGPQAMRRELKNIMSFWMSKGVDGFRVDMAASLVKNDPDKKETIKLWHEMRNWMNQKFPECVLISEWSNPQQAIPAGFHIDFMIHFGIPGYPSLFFAKDTPWGMHDTSYSNCYFNKAGKGSIEQFVENFKPAYLATKEAGYIALPTANHDYQRPNVGTRNTFNQLKVAMTFFFTMPGTPFLYYGDEIGMKYQMNLPNKEGSNERAGTRTPMQWNNEQNAGFSTCEPKELYLPVDTEEGKLTVTTQEKDPSSLLNYVRQLIRLRQSSEALGNTGDWELISSTEQPYPMIYKRTDKTDTFIIALNPSAKTVSASFPAQKGKIVEQIVGDKKQGNYKSGSKTNKIKLKGISALIFKLK